MHVISSSDLRRLSNCTHCSTMAKFMSGPWTLGVARSIMWHVSSVHTTLPCKSQAEYCSATCCPILLTFMYSLALDRCKTRETKQSATSGHLGPSEARLQLGRGWIRPEAEAGVQHHEHQQPVPHTIHAPASPSRKLPWSATPPRHHCR